MTDSVPQSPAACEPPLFAYFDGTSEEWRPVVGYEGWYEVSSFGSVRRIMAAPKAVPGRLLKPTVSRDGYLLVPLSRHSIGKTTSVHKLVAEAFIGPRPEGWFGVNHKDGVKTNNRLSNLEWASYSENTQHAYDNGLIKVMRGSRHHQAKISESDVIDIRRKWREGIDGAELARQYGMKPTNIYDIIYGKIWAHVPGAITKTRRRRGAERRGLHEYRVTHE